MIGLGGTGALAVDAALGASSDSLGAKLSVDKDGNITTSRPELENAAGKLGYAATAVASGNTEKAAETVSNITLADIGDSALDLVSGGKGGAAKTVGKEVAKGVGKEVVEKVVKETGKAAANRIVAGVAKSGQKAIVKEGINAAKDEAETHVSSALDKVGMGETAGAITDIAFAASKGKGLKGAQKEAVSTAVKLGKKQIAEEAKDALVANHKDNPQAPEKLPKAKSEIANRFDKDTPKQQEFTNMREQHPKMANTGKHFSDGRSGQLPKPDVPDLIGPSKGKETALA